ncbi:MAG: hypothetical protein J6A77_05290 [Lachnospiraceae bacterium]|nr:hypothetical protein [Lachnospiraceae bacterium]
MRKNTYYSMVRLLSWLFFGFFLGAVIKDAIQYNSMLNSAPFYVFVLANIMKFLVPCAVFAGIAHIFKQKQRNKISVPESNESRLELLKKYAEYDRSKEEAYETEYHLGGEIPAVLERYGFYDYIKDVDTASDEMVFQTLHFVCDHFGHDGSAGLTGTCDITGLIEFCEQHDGKMNCRGLAMLLASLLRLFSVKARHITCMPYEDPFHDCHVVVDCLLPSGKRIMLDPTWRLYLKDAEGRYVSLERFRELLFREENVFANPEAAYNGNGFDKEYYRNYMTKNTVRFSRGTLCADGMDDNEARRVELIPAYYPVKNFDYTVRKNFVYDDRMFWRM